MSSKSARSRPSAADRLRVPGKAPHVVLVEARFYDDLADELAAGAIAVLQKAGCNIERVIVPGALEIPGAIAMLVTRPRRHGPAVDGFVALGCVIRGETTHYEIVSGESARGLMSLSLTGDIAIGNGILTVETEKQAWERARRRDLDKGGDAARACLRMIALRRQPRGTT